MKLQRFLLLLTVVNLVLLLWPLREGRPVLADAPAPVLRGRALEIVDGEGRVRARLTVLPAGKSQNGDPYPETVQLSLITERGRPSVKITTSEEAAGLMFAGPSNTRATWVQLGAKGNVSSLTLKNEDGRERIVKP